MKKLAFIVALLLAATQSFATDIKIVVPFAPGGLADQSARTIEKILSQSTPYNYRVEYRAGAGGQIGAKYVADQHGPETVLMVHSASVVLQSMVDDPMYQLTSFVPVATIGSTQWMLITHKDSHVNTLDKLLSTKDPVFFGSSGEGTTNHIAGKILQDATKQNLIHVPFKGEAAAFTDLLGNRVSLLFAGSGLIRGNNNIKVLAVSGQTRHRDYPDAPTLAERGIKGFETNLGWLVLLANPGADPAVIKQIQTAIEQSFKDDKMIQPMISAGVEVEKGSPLNTKQFLDSEQKKLRKFVK
jgi:tripartite-type tricarboxylate transporter receptor subunit TctC